MYGKDYLEAKELNLCVDLIRAAVKDAIEDASQGFDEVTVRKALEKLKLETPVVANILQHPRRAFDDALRQQNALFHRGLLDPAQQDGLSALVGGCFGQANPPWGHI